MTKKVKKKTTKKTSPKTVKKKTTKKKATKKAVKKKAKKVLKSKKTVKAKKKATRKVAKKKTSTQSGTKTRRRRKKSTLTAKELTYFRGLLIEKLKEIVGDVNHIEDGALKTSRLDSSGDLSSMPIHMADIGSDNYEQEFALGLMDSERKIVHEIYAALQRIESKTYGICEGTGEPIPKKRLEGIPWTRYCVQYAEMLEKGLVLEEDAPYAYDEDQDDFDIDDYDEDMEDHDMDDYFLGYDDDEEDEE